MKILLAGARGQLGSELAGQLEAAGFGVRGCGSETLDITDRKRVFEEVRALRPGVIANCGAYTRVDLAERERERAFAVNRDGPANLAEAAREAGAVLVHISTDFVFDGLKSTPYTEADPPNPLGVYGESKLAGEREIMERLEDYMIIRTSWLYGGNGQNFVKTILRHAAEREFLNVVYDQAGTPTWAADLAGALVGIIKGIGQGANEYGIYNYSNEGVASWYDFAEAILDEARPMGFRLKCRAVRPILTAEYPAPARRPAYSVLDKGRIKKTFGADIPHWRASLRKMLCQIAPGKKEGALA